MALSRKDMEKIMEARKTARRAIPQIDPAEVVVSPPEPEFAAPPQPAAIVEPEPTPAPIEQEPKETLKPPTGSVVVLEPDDPRTQPVPPDDPYTPTTLRMRNHHRRQLKAEAYYKSLLMQDVIETALDEYFKKRYGGKKRG
jgi:hypothetical protein